MKHYSLIIVMAAMFAGCNAPPDVVECFQLDPLKKVLKEQTYFENKADVAAVAKGETASFQFLVRSTHAIEGLRVEATELSCDGETIPACLKAFVGYVFQGRSVPRSSKDRLVSASGYFPDPLLEIETIDVAPMSNQPVWIDYTVPRTAKEGRYTARVTFSGKVDGRRFKFDREISAKVYPVVLPEQTLSVVNWHFIEEKYLLMMNDDRPLERYSDRWWELVTVMASKMGQYSQNVYKISPLDLCEFTIAGSTYEFDFSNFDRMVEIFLKEGKMTRLAGSHLASRAWGGWWDPFAISVPASVVDGKTVFELKLLESPAAKAFLSQFIPALDIHLKEKGWDKMYYQHIADEPLSENKDSYIAIARYIKSLAPDFKFIDAVYTSEVASVTDIIVPQLNYYHSDYNFYTEHQRKGAGEVWFYTCMNPQGNYANRYLEQPLIQTRFLHWINYLFGATGYLHWGLNCWWTGYVEGVDSGVRPQDAPYGESSWIFEGGGNLPAGDSWITYPAYGKLYGSIRFEAMRDGIADYELLKLLEKSDPQAAKELAYSTIFAFDAYDSNIEAFRLKRIKLLELLSATQR